MRAEVEVNMGTNHFVKQRKTTKVWGLTGIAPLVAAFAAAGCTSNVVDSDEQPEGIDSVLAGIQNGSAWTQNYSGFVKLQYDYNGQRWTFCSGTLIANKVVLTNRHCIDDKVGTGQRIYAVNGNQTTSVVPTADDVRYHPRSGPGALNYIDVAMLRLSAPMAMYRSSPPNTFAYTGYFRPFYWGADSALQGAAAFCQGAGPGGYNAQTTVGNFTLHYTPSDSTDISIYGNSAGMGFVGGDSGGGCMAPRYDLVSAWPLQFVQRGIWNPSNAYGHGAEQWRDWAFWTLYSGFGA
jgi:hypothetical protein